VTWRSRDGGVQSLPAFARRQACTSCNDGSQGPALLHSPLRHWGRRPAPRQRLQLNTNPHHMAKYAPLRTLQNIPEISKGIRVQVGRAMVRLAQEQCKALVALEGRAFSLRRFCWRFSRCRRKKSRAVARGRPKGTAKHRGVRTMKASTLYPRLAGLGSVGASLLSIVLPERKIDLDLENEEDSSMPNRTPARGQYGDH